MPGSPLELSLVYNPLGAYLPPAQAKLEEQYKVNGISEQNAAVETESYHINR